MADSIKNSLSIQPLIKNTHPNPFEHLRQERGYIAIIDSLQFDSKRDCEIALRRNDFEPLSKLPGPWVGEQPEGIFFDARKYEQGIYSNAGYWEN